MSVSLLERALEGTGYHRSVLTHASLDLPSTCTRWVTVEDLPSAALFDPSQLRHFARRETLGGAAGAVALMGEATVETPVADAPRAMALVYGSFEADSSQLLHLRAAVPFHMRYAEAGGGGAASHAAIELPLPTLMVCCADSDADTRVSPPPPPRNVVADDSACPPLSMIGSSWREACGEAPPAPPCGRWRHLEVDDGDVLRARVPVGQAEQSPTAVMVTVLGVVMATLWLAVTLWMAPTPM